MTFFLASSALVGSSLIRIGAENEIDQITTEFLRKQIDIEEATRIISQSPRRYLIIVTAKAVCDTIFLSITGGRLYQLLKELWNILKPLLQSSASEFLNGLTKCIGCIQNSAIESPSVFQTFQKLWEKISSKHPTTIVLQILEYISEIIFCAKIGLCNLIQFELTKYYLEIRGLIRALCEKFNINFFKYVPKPDEGPKKHKDEPSNYALNIPLEHFLHGTEREFAITREVREIDKAVRMERKTSTIRIKSGCKEGHVIRLKDAGDRDPSNIPADILITIRSIPHALYQRQGSDLIYTKTINDIDANSHRPVQVPLLEGQTVSVNPGGTIDQNTELSIDGYGLPDPDNENRRGRMLVRFHIQTREDQIHCNAMPDFD